MSPKQQSNSFVKSMLGSGRTEHDFIECNIQGGPQQANYLMTVACLQCKLRRLVQQNLDEVHHMHRS